MGARGSHPNRLWWRNASNTTRGVMPIPTSDQA